MAKKCPEFENHERWLVSYADMLTLLFAVFVTLYALNLSDEDAKPSTSDVAGSMQESFATPLEDIPVSRRIGPMESGMGVFDYFKGNQAKPSNESGMDSDGARIKIIEDDMNKISYELKERLYGPNKYVGSEPSGEQRIVNIVRTGRGFKIQLFARHFFKSGSYKIRPESLKDLDAVIKNLKKLEKDITIEGHTDSIPSRGKFTNWELSSLRASDVLQYMIKKHNFPATRLSAAGYADFKPIASNGTEQGRYLNRRIEMSIDYGSPYE